MSRGVRLDRSGIPDGLVQEAGEPPAPAPVVVAVSPSTGSDAGGTPITVTTENAVTGAALFIGGVAATSVVVVSPVEVTAVTPAGTLGGAAVRLVNPDSQEDTLADGFTHTAAPPAPTLDWNADWSNSLGTSTAAIRDGTRFTMSGGSGLEVIPSDGLDFPSANVLRVTAQQATTGYAFLRKTGLPIPAVGESRSYRWYARLPQGISLATEDGETHPHQDGNAASQSNWLWHVYHATPGGTTGWTPQLRPSNVANAFPNDRWTAPVLSYDQTYRWELIIERTGTLTFKMHVRIYNAVGTLLHGNEAFTNQNLTNTLASFQVGNDFTWLNVAAMEGFNAGLNGLSGSGWFPSILYMYQGAIATGINQGWLGPYNPDNG